MNVVIFGFGFFVTLLVFSALGLLIWGAILDGRYEEPYVAVAPVAVAPVAQLERRGDAA